MAGYTKLFSSLLMSSVWFGDDKTLRVWIAMLAMKNAHGVVEGTIEGFAILARVTRPEMEKAVRLLSSADPDSRNPDHEGRRIESVRGGWRVLNHDAYRNIGQSAPGSRAAYMREYGKDKA